MEISELLKRGVVQEAVVSNTIGYKRSGPAVTAKEPLRSVASTVVMKGSQLIQDSSGVEAKGSNPDLPKIFFFVNLSFQKPH